MNINEFSPLNPVKEEPTYLEGFQTHMYIAFREFDITFYETYVFSVVLGCTLLWAIATVLQWLCT